MSNDNNTEGGLRAGIGFVALVALLAVIVDFQGLGITGQGAGSGGGCGGGCIDQIHVLCTWNNPARECPKDDPDWNCEKVETSGFSGTTWYNYPETCDPIKRYAKNQAELDQMKTQHTREEGLDGSWCKSTQKYKDRDMPCGDDVNMQIEPQGGFPTAKPQWDCGFRIE